MPYQRPASGSHCVAGAGAEGEESDFLFPLLDISLFAMSLPAWNTTIYYILQNPLWLQDPSNLKTLAKQYFIQQIR